MKTIGLFEAKAKLSEVCVEVTETGETCTITKRGKPIVHIIPVNITADPVHEFRHLSICNARKAYESKYGPITDEFELAPRELDLNRKYPLND